MKYIYVFLMSIAISLSASAQSVTGNAPVQNEEEDTCIVISEVVVTGLTGNAKLKDTPMPVMVVSQRDMQNQAFTNIIDAVATQPGVAQITTGGGISKPVIRGLGYNRVVVVSDNVRQEGQQWGDEHGVEVDAAGVSSVEILKGPASLRYGSDAIAGVMILHPQRLMAPETISANVATEYQTNSGLIDYSLNMAGNHGGIDWGWRYSEKLAHAYKNKYDGYVLGSQFHERALSGLLGLRRQWGSSILRLSYYNLVPGLIEGDRDEDTGEFVRPVIVDGEEDEVVASRHDLKTYGHGLPYQRINHYKAVSDNTFYIGEGNLRAVLAYQNNRRQEFEEVIHPDEPGLDLSLHTVNYDVHYTFPTIVGWQLVCGVGGMYQRSMNKGEEFLIPDYNLFDAGVFATAGRSFGKAHVSGGVRYDNRHLNSRQLIDDGEERFAQFSRSFSGMTGSVGLAYNLTSHINLRANLSRGFRAPNISELGSNGIHEGTLRYEIGNSKLKPEFSTQFDLGGDYSSEFLTLQLSLFTNFVDNYIFSHRLTDIPEGIDAEGNGVYQYTAGDARLVGGELSVELHPHKRIHFENAFSYVDAVQLHQSRDKRHLPFIPAPRWTSNLHIDLRPVAGWTRNLCVVAGMQCFFRQNHFYEADDTETATPSYTVFNLALSSDIHIRGRHTATVTITADNIFDRAYQSHLSRLKYAPVNNVTQRRGIYNQGRNFGVKVSFPIM